MFSPSLAFRWYNVFYVGITLKPTPRTSFELNTTISDGRRRANFQFRRGLSPQLLLPPRIITTHKYFESYRLHRRGSLPNWDMQNPSVLGTSRDSKNDSNLGARREIQRRRRHAPSCMGATELQRNWPEMRKTLGKPGFCSKGFRKLTERTGTEQLGVFPTFLRSSRGVLRQDSARPKFGSVDDQATTIGAMAMNQFRDSVAGYCQDWVLYAPVVPGRLN